MSMDITCCLSGRAYSPKRCSLAERAVPALIYVKRASMRDGIPCLIAATCARGVILELRRAAMQAELCSMVATSASHDGRDSRERLGRWPWASALDLLPESHERRGP